MGQSNHQKRLQKEKSGREFYSEAEKFEPGDQVLISIPANRGETDRVWGYVLKKTAKPGKLWVVIDAVALINRSSDWQPGKVVEVDLVAIMNRIPVDPSHPVLSISLIDGSPQEMLRVDGKTSPIVVRIDEDNHGSVYTVTHKGFKEEVR